MSKLRVHELARELNVESKILLSKLKGAGAKVLSHQSTLTDQQVSELRGAFGAAPSAGATAAQAAPTTSGGKPKVVIRRRAASSDGEAVPPTDAIESAAPSAAVQEPEEVPAPVVAAPAPQAFSAAPQVATRAPSATAMTPRAAPVSAPAPEEEDEPAEVAEAAEPQVEAEAELADEPAEAPVAEAPRAAAPPVAAPAQSGVARRREMGGATIVRKATKEEIENLESANKKRHTGRKEDHRGTRVTGLGLLSNRVSASTEAPGSQQASAQAALQQVEEGWGNRRSGGVALPVGKDKKTLEEEELARKKAAAKSKQAKGGVTMRDLLQQAEILTSDEEVKTDHQGRTVYTPTAPRGKRDIKRRKDLKKTQITTPRAAYRVIEMADAISVGELGKQMGVKSAELIKKLMAQGIMATINQSIDFDTASLLASDLGFEVKSNLETVEDILSRGDTDSDADKGERSHRPPIVTIMGHVDHGKTSILDAIRSANVAGGEAGGITQHIGAYSVENGGKKITFLDTPGHEAFSSMRARGAKVTDIVVLVVAADDGVMPQTIEAISHAKAANVPIIVAVNKIDKPNTNLDRVFTELTEHGVQAEEWGGETQFIKTSAVKKTGIKELLDAILLQAEVLDLKASQDGLAEGAVIEAHLDKGRGPVATIVVQNGTLTAGEYVVAGTVIGRVRAMSNYLGKEVLKALPSDPVEVIGLSGVPMAGDKVNAVADEKTAREIADWRIEQARKAAGTKSSASSLADLLAKVSNSDIPEVPIIIKGDTRGSVEAISEAILKLNTDRVKNRIIHSAVGGVSESDVTLSQASGALVIGFNVRAARGLDEQADKAGVAIKYFSIIYEIVDAVKAIMVGKLPPIVSEVVLGHAEIRKLISVPKIGVVGGSAVIDGKVTRQSLVRLIRNNIVIYTGKLASLRRFKDEAKEVVQGYECGIGIDGYNDLKEGDVVEAYVLEETAATL